MASNEEIIQLNLDRERRAYQARELQRQDEKEAEENEEKGRPKQMGWLILIFALALTSIQLGIEWLSLGTIGWMLAAPISVVLWFMLRPYTQRIKTAKFILNTSLIVDSLPIIGLLPVDIVAILYVFVKSRSALAQHLARLAEKRQKTHGPLPMAA
jgi:hypothetical protein